MCLSRCAILTCSRCGRVGHNTTANKSVLLLYDGGGTRRGENERLIGRCGEHLNRLLWHVAAQSEAFQLVFNSCVHLTPFNASTCCTTTRMVLITEDPCACVVLLTSSLRPQHSDWSKRENRAMTSLLQSVISGSCRCTRTTSQCVQAIQATF